MSDEDRRITPDRRGPGRPREFDDPSQLVIMLDGALHEQVCKEAKRLGVSVSAAARALLAAALVRRGVASSTST